MKTSQKTIQEIQYDYLAGFTMRQLADKYKFSLGTIHKIVHSPSNIKVNVRPKILGGAKHPRAKLSDKDVEEVKLRYLGGESPKLLSKIYGISAAYAVMLGQNRRR